MSNCGAMFRYPTCLRDEHKDTFSYQQTLRTMYVPRGSDMSSSYCPAKLQYLATAISAVCRCNLPLSHDVTFWKEAQRSTKCDTISSGHHILRTPYPPHTISSGHHILRTRRQRFVTCCTNS